MRLSDRFDLWRGLAAALVVLIATLETTVVSAQDTDDPESQLQEIESAIREREAREKGLDSEVSDVSVEVEKIRRDMIDAAAVVQDQEAQLSDTEREIADLDRRYEERQATFEQHRAELEKTLAALALFARSPPQALIARPGEWADTVRGLNLLDDAIPALKQSADAAAAEAAALAALRDARSRRQTELAEDSASLTEMRADLRRLLERKSSLHATLVAERRRIGIEIAALGAEATDTRDLIDRLEMARAEAAARAAQPVELPEPSGTLRADDLAVGAPPPPPPEVPVEAEAVAPAAAPPTELAEPDTVIAAPEADVSTRLAALPISPPRPPVKSSLPYPVHGDVIARFGARAEGGQKSLGASIRTRERAQVVAPRRGEVVFAGPFRGYGQLLILEHDGGYHSLLSGFSRIDAQVGQQMLAGEPVGVMGIVAESATILYIEIRQNRQPIDPIPWLLAGDRKVSG